MNVAPDPFGDGIDLDPVTARITPAHYQAVLRQDFAMFIRRCFHELWPATPLKWNWHIDMIANRLEAVRRGECRRLIINMPPRGAKSLCASIAFPAFCLGHNPSAQLMNVSYAQDLSEKLSADTRKIMLSSWYRQCFGPRLKSRRPAIKELVTHQGGVRYATSVGGVMTGRGGEIIIIDDPINPGEAVSDALRKGVNDWYDATVPSRLNDKADSAIVIIMQRLHEDDLVGHVQQHGDWEVLSFPAIAEEDEIHQVDTLFGPQFHHRLKGEALHPARESLAALEELKAVLGSYNFAAQYQQRPTPFGGGMIKLEWFKHYEPTQLPKGCRIVQSWDCASKKNELADYSVCTTWATSGKLIFLLDVYRKRLDYPELKKAVLDQAKLHGAATILVEDAASGIALIQDLKSEGYNKIQAVKVKDNKIMRMHAQTAIIEAGRVFLPNEAHWLDDYTHEMMMFPNSKYKDQVDSTAQALDFIANHDLAQQWVDYYAEQAAKVREARW